MIKRLCVIGVGLIGGSLARSLRRVQYCGEIVGCARNRENLERAREMGVIDRFEMDPAAAVKGCDVVVLAVPMGAMREVLKRIRPKLAADVVVTDVGSAKRDVLDAVAEVFGEVPSWFVPGHPVAGTERSGVDASFPSLYDDRPVILTPVAVTSPAAVRVVSDMWERSGARVSVMDLQRHDEVLAATSHLPHVLAYTLVDTLARMDQSEAIFDFAAGGFRDFTRIAASDPAMWRDICVANNDAVVAVLEQFQAHLDEIRQAIAAGDDQLLETVFGRAKAARDRRFPPGQDS